MEAPSTTKGKSSSSSPTSWLFFSRKAWFFAALVIFVISTTFAFLQLPRRNPFDAESFHGLRWFLYPIERNAFRRLPVITSGINDIFVVPDTKRLWIVGNGGLLAYSDDGGEHWVQPLIMEGSTPQPEKGAKGAWGIMPDLMSEAYAAQGSNGQDETRRPPNEGGINPKSGASTENPEIQQQGLSSQQFCASHSSIFKNRSSISDL
jgi:hypothetical protein